MQMQSREVFISYAWGGESENIVNEIDKAFEQKSITLIRDKRDLGFKGMITNFMEQIGAGKAIVVVISDKYLKSPYCMFELLEIYRNMKFAERIFPVVMEDSQIFEPIHRLHYLKYWQDKKNELDEAIKQFGTDAITVIGDDYKTYKKIFDNFGEIINILKDINSLSPQMHRDAEFKILIEALEYQINKNLPTSKIAENPISTIENTTNLQGNGNIVIQGSSSSNISINTSQPTQSAQSNSNQVDALRDKRKNDLLKQIDMQTGLLNSYEEKLILNDDDPKKVMIFEREIAKIKERISSINQELNAN